MNAAPVLSVRGVGKSFGARRVAHNISFNVGSGEVVCLLGQSGSGKSTVLRIVSGIERADAGEISIDGLLVEGLHAFVAPEKRRVGLVFQDLALFPHLNARSNVMFGLFRESRAVAARRAETLLEMVGLGGHATSFPHQLSGGEQQRLAVARAMAPEPKVMLLDEPFSGLDDRLRDGVRGEVLDLLRSRGAATLFVTHDPDEALRSADRIVLLRQGHIVQAGPPAELWTRPADLGVAAFFSPVCTIPAQVKAGFAMTPIGPVSAPGFPEGQVVTAALRPRDLECGASGKLLRPDKLALASDGLHVRFAADEALPAGLSGVFEPTAPIRAGEPVPVAIRPGHGFVFHRECS